MRIKLTIWLLIGTLAIAGCAFARDFNKYHAMGYVVVSPNGPKDGADFGPGTSGTKTDGIQEALDYAKKNAKDVYIAGGGLTATFKAGAKYELKETLRIPWMQNFKLDGGEAFITYTPKSGDAIVIDSQMSCTYKFGVVCGSMDGAVVRFKPETKGPDNFSCITCSTFTFNALVGGGGAWPGKDVKGLGYGLVLDTSAGSITANRIFPLEIVGCDIGLYLKEGAANNWIECPFLHLCNTGIQIGDTEMANVRSNRIRAYIDSHGIKGSIGARVFGQRNTIELDVAQTSDGKNIIFEPSARDNLVTAINLPNGVTNNATVPTNRIITTYPLGFDAVTTPPIPKSGEAVMNREPYTVKVMIASAGDVTGWTLIDANGSSRTFKAGLTVGQEITLEPADQIRFEYNSPPAWVWRAMR